MFNLKEKVIEHLVVDMCIIIRAYYRLDAMIQNLRFIPTQNKEYNV